VSGVALWLGMMVGESNVALAAARAVACAHGVRCEDAVVIAAGSNVLVHLKPTPIVARVMTGTAALHDDIARWLEREVAVGAFVAERGGPVVPPSDLLAPGPYQQYGFWMTFWKFVAHEPADRAPDAREVGRSMRELHTVLAGFAGDLEPLSSVCNQIERQLAQLRPCPWLSEKDIEDVCAGPVAWDLAGLIASARAHRRSETYVQEILDGYGCRDLKALAPFLDADALYAAVWQAFDTQRRRPARTTAPTRLKQWLEQSAD